jgi:hypothetical protein
LDLRQPDMPVDRIRVQVQQRGNLPIGHALSVESCNRLCPGTCCSGSPSTSPLSKNLSARPANPPVPLAGFGCPLTVLRNTEQERGQNGGGHGDGQTSPRRGHWFVWKEVPQAKRCRNRGSLSTSPVQPLEERDWTGRSNTRISSATRAWERMGPCGLTAGLKALSTRRL